MANTRKAATKFGSTIDNEPRLPTNIDSNTIDKMLMSHLISLQETINKMGEEIRTLTKENAKFQNVVMENESLKKVVVVARVGNTVPDPRLLKARRQVIVVSKRSLGRGPLMRGLRIRRVEQAWVRTASDNTTQSSSLHTAHTPRYD